MNSLDNMNKDILGLVRDGKIGKELAFNILKGLNQRQEDRNEDIAIIGMACRLPGANNIKEYWDNLKHGICSIKSFPESRRRDTDVLIPKTKKVSADSYSLGGYLDEIDKFDAAFFGISPMEARSMDPAQRLFLETSWEALEDAGYGGDELSGTYTGVYVGVDHMQGPVYRKIIPKQDMLTLTGTWPGLLSRRISYLANFRGPAMVIDTACSSGLVAVHTACKDLRNNECQLALAGGVNIYFLPLKGGALEAIESADMNVRSLDKKASGTIWSEGVAAVLLKPLRKAIEDGDSIYAVIKSSAVNNDGESNGLTAPNAKAQEEVIIRAWENAKINPESISYIEAHSTGSYLGDPIEVNGLTNAFRKYTDKMQFCGIGSVKPNIGHAVAASGISELIKVALSLKNELIPPSINFEEPNPFISFSNSPFFINDKLKAWNRADMPRRAGINSFAFSGTNCHMVIEEAPEIASGDKAVEKDSIFALSAKSINAMQELITKYIIFLKEEKNLNIGDICYTSNIGRGHYGYRLAIISKDTDNLISSLEKCKMGDFGVNNQNDIYYGIHKIVPANRKTKEIGEITEEEKRNYNRASKSILSNNDNTCPDMKKLCELYIKGASIEWKLLYKDGKKKRVQLPVYPFERKRCWVEAPIVELLNEDHADGIISKTAQTERNRLIDVQVMGKEIGEIYSDKEKTIANIFGSSLGLCEIDINDNFFEIGGNSLISIKVEALAEENNIKISSEDIYEYKTVRELAQFIEGHGKEVLKEVMKKEDIKEKVKESLHEEVNNNSNIKVIENIEPFNELFYKNCFYNSCFPVIRSYEKNIISYLVNDICIYTCEGKGDKLKLGVKFVSSLPMEQILNNDGIMYKTKRASEDIIKDIIDNISNNKPVIIWIDCFYESIRKDTYQKQHWPHTLLIYGYDLSNSTFNIIEHGNRDNLAYMKRVIAFDDIRNAYNGFMENFAEKIQEPVLNTFLKTDNSLASHDEKKNYKLEYLKNLTKNSDLMLKGINNIRKYSNSFEKIVMDEESFFENGEEIIKILNTIINAKQAEKYKIEAIFVHQKCEAVELLNFIIEQWVFMRKIVAKSVYARIYNRDQNRSLIDALEQIYNYEFKYFNALTQCLSI